VCTWVDLCAPRRDEVLAVTRQLGLPYRAVLATLSSAPESWCHASRDHISVRVQEVRRDPLSGQIEADPLDLIVGQAIVVSVHAGPLPALIRLRRRAGQNPDYVGATALALLAAILGEVLSSPEALARWMVLDSAAVQGRAPQMAGLRRA
jgi:Mg2+ and Co2+ transporter CorA